MNDTLEMYNSLMMLKRMSRNNPKRIDQHKYLEMRRDEKSNNILVICRTKKDCREAMKFIAKDNLDKCKVHLTSGILELEDTTIKFVPVSWADDLEGFRYKEYYFEEEFHIHS